MAIVYTRACKRTSLKISRTQQYTCKTTLYDHFVDKYNLASASPLTICISLMRCSLLSTPKSSCSIFSSNMQNILPLIFSSLKAFLYFFKLIASNNCRTLTKMMKQLFNKATYILHVAHVIMLIVMQRCR